MRRNLRKLLVRQPKLVLIHRSPFGIRESQSLAHVDNFMGPDPNTTLSVKIGLGAVVILGLLCGPLSSRATLAQPKATTAAAEVAGREAWKAEMSNKRLPKVGCFNATYPKTEWQEAPCGAAPQYPQQVVGGVARVDWAAQTSGPIASATGSFDPGTHVTGETGTNPLTMAANVPNMFSLQINTNLFRTSECNHAAVPDICRGWQQFVYSNFNPRDNTTGLVYISYWLLYYDTTCPSGWLPRHGHCYKNALPSTLPAQTAENLGQLELRGYAAGSGANSVDEVIVSSASSGRMGALAVPSVFDPRPEWHDAEFNVFGDGNGSQANFNDGTAIVVRTTLNDGTTNAPSCPLETFTAETNNLGPLAPPCCPYGGASPAVVFVEQNSPYGGPEPPCVSGHSVGEPHLMTFYGFLYDFQATGDFLLAEADPDFVVQTRQASGAPWWPNVAVNKAVATRMGQTRVAVCLDPSRLEINGEPGDLKDGESISLPSDVVVARKGNEYAITRRNGQAVYAILNSGRIDISLNLGRVLEPNARGLLGNANGNVNQLQTRFGAVLDTPVSFADLYHRFADSWRVRENESLLCSNNKKIESGVPGKPLSAKDLEGNEFERARTICSAAGVKAESLLDACTLDTAVLGDKSAAEVFVRLPPPRAEMKLR
jgi:hypothetical protein